MIKIETTHGGIEVAGGFPDVPEYREIAKSEAAGVVYGAISLYSRSYKLSFDAAKLDILTELLAYEHKVETEGGLQHRSTEYTGNFKGMKKRMEEITEEMKKEREGLSADDEDDDDDSKIDSEIAEALKEALLKGASDFLSRKISEKIKEKFAGDAEEDEDDQAEN